MHSSRNLQTSLRLRVRRVHRMQLHKKRMAMQRGLAVAMIRPFGKVLSTTKMVPTSSKGSLYEFFKLPYNPATPSRRKSALWESLKTLLYFVQFLFKSIPVWIEIITKWLNPPPPKSIAGWNALVTGGSNGIGRAVTLELAKFGCNVIIADVDLENGEKTVQEALKYRVKAVAYKVDVSDYESIVNLGQKIERDFGRVDILVNNAGIIPYLVPDEYSPENIRRMMEVNVLSHFWTIKTFLPGMYHRRRGHIVGLSSRAAYIPTGYMLNYATTKYAVRGFMEDLHDEIYHAGMEEQVVTTTVFPGLINTRKESIDHFLTLPGYDQMTLPTPEEAGKTIVEGIRTNQRKLYVPNILQTWQVALFEFQNRIPSGLAERCLFNHRVWWYPIDRYHQHHHQQQQQQYFWRVALHIIIQ
ncbi:estradiol 17-beta-dehydrogenase 11-like [Ochlerotatus camptorhynchus]|uniref:estradiol 17-beta-dehydrogenase 11-like n=1 Tax=Ochlerotatus camptorhynchus TaxID=644619 RepID=UPI0031D4D9F5